MLIRKMLRDIAGNKMAYLACTAVITIGLITYTALQTARDNLFTARDEFYEKFHLAEGFARVRSMPYPEVEKLREIPGIHVVQGRLVKDVRVLGLTEDKNVYLRLISLDDRQPYPLNGVKLLRGSFPEEQERGILLADKFFTAHGLNLGETITVIIEGRKVDLTITGTGQSPEYVYAIRDSGNIFADPQAFEVAYIPYSVMENLFNLKGIVNDVTFTLQPGYEFEDVEGQLKTRLEKYGLESRIPRQDQPSHAMLEEELKGLAKTSTSVPLLFLSIAAIILYIMLKRLVESQRGQIGILQAFGYRPGEILRHYLSYGLLVGLAGGILGGLLGTALSMSMMEVYREFFSLPDLTGNFSLNTSPAAYSCPWSSAWQPPSREPNLFLS
ncbi:MAG: FtsX-like permease family protein [Thermoanaerobacteraceae bacterium]|nr:FtsX-like permease family protein [Thermoanaerobacteraceae bacterium]